MTTQHRWSFFRSGGLDQVKLTSGADLLNLAQLDPKLWVALSCPVQGLELDEKTLALIDLDGDGRIRVPEILAAIKWLAPHLKSLDEVLTPSAAIPLALFNDQTLEGQSALASAKQILANLGKANATSISVTDTIDTAKIFAGTQFNGDGIIPADAASDADLQQLIRDIIATQGAETDRSGKPGTSQAKIDQFYAALAAFVAWSDQSTAALCAGDATATSTPAALAAVKAVRAKVDDYFARGRLASFDPRALASLNRSESDFASFATQELKGSSEEISGFPLARIEIGKPLPLTEGINPAWSGAIAALVKDAITPILGTGKTSLTAADWATLNARLAPYEAWLASKAGCSVASLGADRARALLTGGGQAALASLIAKDNAVAPQVIAIATVERVVRYYRDLRTLLMNFVNFADLYDPAYPATFQAGTLFIDSRSCDLCIRVDGASPLAAMSKAYIAYCTCTRPGSAPITIAACLTQGDSDYLFAGRHGVFYDRQGRDWDAVITSIVDNPISIGQAFWSPYKKLVRMIEEQVAKRAAAAEAESNAKLATTAEKTANIDKAKPAEAKKIDVGAVAALGVAFGALTTALGYFLGFFKGLAIWEIPLLFVGVILLISTPSMIIAWLKLRQRNLGPILDANGWAINGRVKINVPFGSSLTARATFPEGSTRSLTDPFEDKDAAKRQRMIIVVLILLAAAAIAIRWDKKKHGHYFWADAPAVTAIATPAAAPAQLAPAPTK